MATNPHPVAPKLLNAKYQQLLTKVVENRPQDDLEIIRKAYEFSLVHHQGQVRASGEPFLIHPLEVAIVLADMKLDSTAIAACMTRSKTRP
jgi:guanosine-3',5'-bis(diphosphate) 3'-pyrophosphohydrolase